LMVTGWGYFLIQGVRDPLGGINSLWPLFGIANQMLAAIALCLATTIILKMQLERTNREVGASKAGRPWLAIITLVPLVWLLAVTFTAGVQKIGHPDPRIGFLAQARMLQQMIGQPGTTEQSADPKWLAEKEAKNKVWATQKRNNLLDALVAGVFLGLVSVVVLLSIREWILLLARRKPVVLRESEPVWLPDYAVAESGRKLGGAAGAAALTLALARELSGEAQLERARQEAAHCQCGLAHGDSNAQKIYLEVTERRFNGVRRCC
jgi:carbon starvation protein